MQPQVYKAQRRNIQLGDISLEIAMLPDSSYRLSYTQTAEVVNLDRSSMLRFCRSKYLKTLLGEEFECSTFVEKIFIEGANRPITPVTFELACLYWQKCAVQGNKKAQALVVSLVKRSLYDLADEAFGVKRTKQECLSTLADDLSEQGIARIETVRNSLERQVLVSPIETPSERELKLKIRLASLELEREKLRHSQDKKCFPATDIDKIGVPPRNVIPWIQKTLDWSDDVAAFGLLRRLGYGFKSEPWFKVKVIGELWLLPWSSFDSLTKAVEQFKSEL